MKPREFQDPREAASGYTSFRLCSFASLRDINFQSELDTFSRKAAKEQRRKEKTSMRLARFALSKIPPLEFSISI
jgi:hypothetical protein